MEGSRVVKISDGVYLSSISLEASELLDLVMAEWEKHFAALMAHDYAQPTYYGFAYWLIRYSGLIEPSERAKELIKGEGEVLDQRRAENGD